jgi:hypothetical protein
LGLLGLAIVFRFHGLEAYNLWHDEAWVAVSVVQAGFREMFFSEYPQTTPPLLLILIRILAQFFGSSDWVLRLWPALAGVATTALIYFVCRRLTGSATAGLISMSIWAMNPMALRYSQELKQYSTDAMVGLLLMLLAERIVDRARKEGAAPRVSGFTLLATIIIGFSYPSVFFIAVVGARLAWHLLVEDLPRAEFRRGWWAWMGYVGATSLAFFATYHYLIRPQITDWLVGFWSDNYLPLASPTEVVTFAFGRTYDFFWYLFSDWADGILLGEAPALFALVFLIGTLSLIATRRGLALFYLMAPFALTLLAAALRRYPYGGIRADLFLVPLLFIGVAYGLDRLIAVTRAGPRLSKALVLLLILLFPYLQVIENKGAYLKRNEDMRSVTHTVGERIEVGDMIGVHPAGYYAFRHYDRGTTPDIRSVGSFDDSDLESAEQGIDGLIDSLASQGQLWLVFSRDRGGHRNAYRNLAARRCEANGAWEFENAAAYRFQCDGMAD